MPNLLGLALPNRRTGAHALVWARPESHGPHSYVFQLFAIDSRLELPDTFTLADALQGIVGHVVVRARLDSSYEIR